MLRTCGGQGEGPVEQDLAAFREAVRARRRAAGVSGRLEPRLWPAGPLTG
jgi:hypothetical protein